MNASPLVRRIRPSPIGFAVGGALSLASLALLETHALAHEQALPGPIPVKAAKGDIVQAMRLAEAAVTASPQNAVLRATLGDTYLRAGRFEAAAAALQDALALGDSSGNTTLRLALAEIACGQHRAALATLDLGSAAIAPADLGLALALAGDADRGIAVLTDGLRADAPDRVGAARFRQNLAYAYALDGRWADARLAAGFDLPPDQVDARLQRWAESMQSGGERIRVAGLLNVPVIADAGMPDALALNRVGAPPASADLAPANSAAASATVPSPTLPRKVVMTAVAVVQPVPPVPAAAPRLRVRTAAAWPFPAHRAAGRGYAKVINPDHGLQLGAFTTIRGAERARQMLARQNPRLGLRGFQITPVNPGRVAWRVTYGVDRKLASLTCADVNHHGGGCFVYAANHIRKREALALNTPPPIQAGQARR